MGLIKKVDRIETFGKDQCRIKAHKMPVFGARYEVWFTREEKRFHGKGRFPQVEELMLKGDAQVMFYHTLVRISKKIGDEKNLDRDLPQTMLRCICSLSMWSQDMATISMITGIDLETARSVTFSLYRQRYVTLVQKDDQTRMALTPKGWRAYNDLCDESLEKELLNRTIDIYTIHLSESLKRGRPHI